MFKNNNEKNNITPNLFNTLTAGTIVKGDISTQNDIRIDGTLEGTLETKGKLVIGQTGAIKGEVICQNADIFGEMQGNIKVGELLSLKSGAKFTGEIVTGKLSIEPGAMFTGNCNMGAVVKDLKIGESTKESKIKERSA
jgi:cytoskeletal protein CcmA (bactofilin family)